MGSNDSPCQKKQSRVPVMLGVPMTATVLVLAATCSIPVGPDGVLAGLRFWASQVPQIMGFQPSVNVPDFSKPEAGDNSTTGATLSALPTVISVHDKDWREKLAATIEREPVVVRGLMKGERSKFGDVSELEFNKLRTIYGDDFQVSVFTDFRKDKSAIKMPYREYHERMLAGEKLYARAVPDPGFFTENVDLAWLAEIIGKQRALDFTLMTVKGGSTGGNLPLSFIGSNHVFSQAHCDLGTSVFLMIQGRKRWLFFGPDQTPLMYPYAQQGNVAFNSGVDVFKPDLNLHPEFKRAKGYEVVIETGDVLFFPSMWWHAVQNLDEVTIGTDIPMLDFAGSWRRNSIFALGTMLNPYLIYNSVAASLAGRSIRELYFKGYLIDDKDNNGDTGFQKNAANGNQSRA